MKTIAANVARMIRKDLKEEFPSVTFSVRSENFAGGDAVRVSYDITTSNLLHPDKVRAITNKYEGGYFDGMQDMYVSDFDKKFDESVKYITINANTKPLEVSILPEMLKRYGLSSFEDQEIMAKFNCWKEQLLHRYIYSHVLKGNA
jgi:hypothetical protein